MVNATTTQYRTIEGDTVDLICHHIYGQTAGVVEQVLAANPGLAALGPVLPVGTLVNLPEVRQPSEEDEAGLW